MKEHHSGLLTRLKLRQRGSGGAILIGDALPCHESILAQVMLLHPCAVGVLRLALVPVIKRMRAGRELPCHCFALELGAVAAPSLQDPILSS